MLDDPTYIERIKSYIDPYVLSIVRTRKWITHGGRLDESTDKEILRKLLTIWIKRENSLYLCNKRYHLQPYILYMLSQDNTSNSQFNKSIPDTFINDQINKNNKSYDHYKELCENVFQQFYEPSLPTHNN